MSSEASFHDGWFYKRAGETCGPVSPDQLKELLVAGRVQPRQAVWRNCHHGQYLVQAVQVASGNDARSSPVDAEAAR